MSNVCLHPPPTSVSEEGTKWRSRLAVGCKAGLGVMGASPYDFKTPEASAILTMQHGPQALRLRDVQLRELPLGTSLLHTDLLGCDRWRRLCSRGSGDKEEASHAR